MDSPFTQCDSTAVTCVSKVWHSEEDAGLTKVWQVSWSPDGSDLLVAGSQRVQIAEGEFTVPARVYILNLDDGSLRQLRSGGEFNMAAWSPDGSQVAIYYADTHWSSVRNLYSFFLYTINRDRTDMRELLTVDATGNLIVLNPEEAVSP